MTIKDMHYDFKVKFNKIDSQQNKNLIIPEIDWLLNEAQNIFIDIVAQPRVANHLGFETSQKTIDDIRTLVTQNCDEPQLNEGKELLPKNGKEFYLPDDYRYFVRGYAYLEKGNCNNAKARLYIQQHDDEFEESPFNNSSFEWREVNGIFRDDKIVLYGDDTFYIEKLCIDYIRIPKYIHNAEDYKSGEYNLPNGDTLTMTQDCELPEQTHREIVDIAVMLASGAIQTGDYQFKLGALNTNFLK